MPENKILRYLHNLPLLVKLLIQGLVLTVVLIVFQGQLDGARQSSISYMPPIGIALLIFATYLVQPLVVGVLNIFLINILFASKGWQVGFWLNGIFLFIVFSTINLVLQTTLTLTPTSIAIIDFVLLALPFGCIARFSNGGWKKPIE